ncbi:MAG: hypothetical protein L0K86_03330 [Actinomycetia bacterium]|nr:hypothetical protein [Actinomycetes bacterium]
MLPTSMERPFFAYGIFQPGQLAYFQLGDSVAGWQRVQLPGALLIRDGLPIADLRKNGTVAGAVLTFKPGDSEHVYRRIGAMEPRKHYRWDVVTIAGAEINLLVGRSPAKGSVPFGKAEWDGWDDPLLTTALEVVEETLDEPGVFAWDLKPLFRLQMAYLLLWSSIERYVSLRYHLGGIAKVNRLATEQAFGRSLRQHVEGQRWVFRSDEPTKRVALDPGQPAEAVRYYYQVRCNITHRGKAAVVDHATVRRSLAELLAIFRDVLRAARSDAVELAERGSGARKCNS